MSVRNKSTSHSSAGCFTILGKHRFTDCKKFTSFLKLARMHMAGKRGNEKTKQINKEKPLQSLSHAELLLERILVLIRTFDFSVQVKVILHSDQIL